MIDHQRRLVFVHVQKTGGNAICAALGANADCAEKHYLAPALRELYGATIWDSYFKFTFVRNPWDRLVSWWAMIEGLREQHERGVPLNKFQTYVLTRSTTFEDFLVNCDEEIIDADGSKWIYRNQVDYVSDTSRRLMVNFIGRYETLQRDFKLLLRQIDAGPIELPIINKSVHQPYVEYYSPALVKMVRARFARDIAAFGYEFEGHGIL